MTKLGDTQTIILSKASRHSDGLTAPPASLSSVPHSTGHHPTSIVILRRPIIAARAYRTSTASAVSRETAT